MTFGTLFDAGPSRSKGTPSSLEDLFHPNPESSATLSVGKNAFLTLASDAVVVVGKYCTLYISGCDTPTRPELARNGFDLLGNVSSL